MERMKSDETRSRRLQASHEERPLISAEATEEAIRLPKVCKSEVAEYHEELDGQI